MHKLAVLSRIFLSVSILIILFLWQTSVDLQAMVLHKARLQPQVQLQVTPQPLPFRDVSRAAGIVMQRKGGGTLSKDKGIGQAWGDYDRDGWLDLYVTDSAGANVLYHNQRDGTFLVSELSPQVALATEKSSGALFGDYNNDGWPDLYVLNWGANTLFRNEEGTRFVVVTTEAGVGDESNGKTAAWGDYDNDGLLDLYVANWACEPLCGRPTSGDKDRLYHNNGDGSFVDVTHLLGTTTRGAGFVASFVDYDNDGDLDIYLVNDEYINPIGNVLWRNDGPGCDEWCFVDVSEEAGADTRLMGMGLATSDYDNDGNLDFYFSNVGEAVLLRNLGNGHFVDMASTAGVSAAQTISWGALFFDYDNDGWRDLYLAVANAVGDESTINRLYHNNRDGTFDDLADLSGAAHPGQTLGVAYADYDNDGWVDLLIGNFDGGYRLYRNQLGQWSDARWITIELVGSGPVNRDAIGSRVYITTSDGVTQMQEIKAGSSVGAGNALLLYFGLGRERIDTMRIIWADGLTQEFHTLGFRPIPENRRVQLPYPETIGALLQQFISLYIAR